MNSEYTKLHYDEKSKRFMIDNVELHAGYPVDVADANLAGFAYCTIEADENGWYLTDYPQPGQKYRDLEGLLVDHFGD